VVRTDLRTEWGEAKVEGEEERWHADGCRDVGGVDAEMDGGPCVREAEIERRKGVELAGQQQGQDQGQGAKQWPVREWLAERRVGHYQRTFTFPADVDAVGVRARLGQGLLRILVPKVREASVRAKQVDVECVE